MKSTDNDGKNLKQIMRLFSGGQAQTAAELLYNNYYNKIYGIAFSILNNAAASEDVVHNTMCKLLKTDKGNFPSRCESTWLYSVVKNEALIYIRKQKPVTYTDDLTAYAFEQKSIDDFVDMDSYYSLIKNLNNDQRQVVTLKVLGGYTHREIAKMLGKPTGTIQWIYNTAIKKLRVILSSLLSCVLLFGGLFAWRTAEYIQNLNSVTELPEGFKAYVPPDAGMIFFGAALAASVFLFIFVYTNSHLIPTKTRRK